MNNIKNLNEFLKDKNVEVPMLQRDYAQGRKSQISVANEFLDAIFAVLDDSKQEKTLHIDFIYGYKENNKFLLIDGQQRVTTLWLLHFYIYKKAQKLESISKELAKFSYAVRDSSKKFCKNLLKKDFDLSKNPSKAILDKGGEFEEKENLRSDPTIKAMLNMLDLIYVRLNNKTDLETLIKNLDKITFYVFDMGEFSLGEELYIKMNARGKQLSHYENLKAYIESNSKIADNRTLLANIDNKWADMFFTPNNISAFDKRGIVFLHYANVFFILLNDEIKSGDIKPMIDSANRAIDDKFYKPLQDLENIMLLDKLVDLYKNYSEAFTKSGFLRFSDFKSFKNSEDFLDITGTDIYYFYAALFFIIASKGKNINSQALEDYLRVCKHFIENHRRDNPDEHISTFFNLFKTLSKGYKNIYEFLVQNPTHSFHSNIYALESRKAKLILQSRNGGDKWEEILDKTSNHCVLMGWVDYLLDFSHSDSYENPNFDKFCRYAEVTMHIFDEIQKEKDIEQNEFLPLFQRAFLSIGNYGFWDTNFFYGNYCGYGGFRYHRESWNWLLGGTKNEAKEPYFKTFLDLLLESKADSLDSKMREIIGQCDLSQKKWWEQLLICQDELFKFLVKDKPQTSSITRIRFWNELPKVELLLRKKNIKNVRDLFDYGFYLYCNDKKIQNLSEYTSNEEQYGKDYPLQSHFTISNKEVLCDSMNAKITFGKQEFSIDMDGDIFAEFDRIINEMGVSK